MGTKAARVRLNDAEHARFTSDPGFASTMKSMTCKAAYTNLAASHPSWSPSTAGLSFDEKIRAVCECKIEMMQLDKDMGFATVVDVGSP